jgi:hypothetical protein
LVGQLGPLSLSLSELELLPVLVVEPLLDALLLAPLVVLLDEEAPVPVPVVLLLQATIVRPRTTAPEKIRVEFTLHPSMRLVTARLMP